MSTLNESPAYDVPDDDLMDTDFDGDLLAMGFDDDTMDELMGDKPAQREPGWRRLERAREKKMLRMTMREFEDFDDFEDLDEFDLMSDEYYSEFDH